MPFYSSLSSKGPLNCYEMIYNPSTNRYQYAHRLAVESRWKNYSKRRGYVVYHKDFNKLNNDPDNLEIQEHAVHSAYHMKISAREHDVNTCMCGRCQVKRGGRTFPETMIPWNKGKHLIPREIRVCERVECNNTFEVLISDTKKYCGRTCGGKAVNTVERNVRISRTVKWQWDNLDQTKRLEGVRKNGYNHKNHKVIRIEKLVEKEDVYDITTEKNHNFSLSSGIIVHNSALELFADVVTTPNALQNCTVWVTSDSQKYTNELTKLFDRIGLEERIYDWAWTTGMYGDHFPKINGQPGLGVTSIEDGFHPIDISRLDYEGVLVGFYLTPQGGLGSSGDSGQELIPPWQYIHFRMLGAKKKRCLVGSTRISLLDNTSPTIKEISENRDYYIGKSILSINPGTKKLEYDKITDVQLTVRNARLVRVYLDNGEIVDCTPDHDFIMRDGSFNQAVKLEAHDSLLT